MELNVNFPFYLCLLQSATIALSVALSSIKSRDEVSSLRNVTAGGWLKLVLALLATAAAMLFGLQAILHFQNLPTLVMLTVRSSFSPERVVLTRQTTSYCIEGAILAAAGHCSRVEIGRIIIATLCCGGILLGEYRLLPKVLLTAIPATVFAGFGKAFWSIAAQSSVGTNMSARQTDILIAIAGAALTGICLYRREIDDETVTRLVAALKLRYLPVLAINLVTTAAAVRIGRYALVPMDSGRNNHDYGERPGPAVDMIGLLTVTGITGLVSASKLRRSYTSWPQYIFFALVIMIWSGRRLSVRYGDNWSLIYKAVPNDVALQSVDSDSTAVSDLSEDSDDTHVPEPESSKSLFSRIILVGVVLPAIWLAFLVLNFSQQNHQSTTQAQPILDLNYIPKTEVELVISMYKEPIEEVSNLISTLKQMPNMPDPRVHIYIKDIDANLEEIKEGTGADEVTPLPNIGREAETYLKHILGNWNTLAARTVFLQADVHNPHEFYRRLHDYFVPERTGMLSLGWSGQVCNCDNCGDHFNMWDTPHLFPEISNRINNATKCDKVLLSYKGQFVASAKRIRGVDKSVYRDLHDAFVNRDSWAHQEEYLQGRPDSMDAPVFGYLMERIWNLLFQCNNMDVAWKCPTLLSGNRIGGSVEDCQCLDPMS